MTKKKKETPYECRKVKELTEQRDYLKEKLASYTDSIYKYKFETDKWNMVVMNGYIVVVKKEAFEIGMTMNPEFFPDYGGLMV